MWQNMILINLVHWYIAITLEKQWCEIKEENIAGESEYIYSIPLLFSL